MKMSRTILRVLNVHRDEWWLVQKLFLLQFFQGAGIAFFFTSAFSRFLDHFQVTGLAYVFLLASALLWVTGFFYSKLEHRLSASRLNIIITAILAGSILFFRAGAEYIDDNWYYFLMLAWFYVLYLLNNLMFWGIAAQLYDVRQSKRLFGVISAGDIPAKFIGYSVASLIVHYTGTLNLLLVGFLFIMLSFRYLVKIMRKENSHKTQHEVAEKHNPEVHNIVKDYTVNTLVRRVALLSLIVSACIILINYAFYAEVKSAYKNDVELASFIAKFLAAARLAALFIKIIFTSRLLYWLGNRTALMITPLLLILLVSVLLLTDSMSSTTKIVLYIFGFSAILTDVLNSAINSPVLLTFMQPLSSMEKLRAHNIVKGIMDPFAYLGCGLLLLTIYRFELDILQILSAILLFLAIAWVIGIFRVNQQYLKTLIKTVSSRFFSQDDFNIYDTTAREMIEKKIKNGTELEVLYILRMLGSRKSEESINLIKEAFVHSSDKVVVEALRLTHELHIKETENDIIELIRNHKSVTIRSEAMKVLSSINYRDVIFEPLMHDSNLFIRRSAIISVLNHSEVNIYKNEAEKRLRDLLASGNTDDKKEATAILYETHHLHFDDQLVLLMEINDAELQHAVIKALGHHATDNCLRCLVAKFDNHEKNIIEALILARDKALPFIKRKILSGDSSGKQKEKLIAAVGRISGKASHDLLLSLLDELPAFRPYILKTLHRCHFRSNNLSQPVIESLIRQYLLSAAGILHMQKNLQSQKDSYKLLLGSLQLELNEIRESLLCLFSFIYDRNQISKIKTALEINKKSTIANAIELVDMTVKKEYANPFNALFEKGDLEHRCGQLKNIFPKDIYPGISETLNEILNDKNLLYNNWTKACSLYTSKKPGTGVPGSLVNKYIDTENRMVKETAAFAAGIQ
jgi:hypothetical protein